MQNFLASAENEFHMALPLVTRVPKLASIFCDSSIFCATLCHCSMLISVSCLSDVLTCKVWETVI